MSERAVATAWMLGGQSSLYIHEDRVEVGATDAAFGETLARVAYRDARRLVAWSATRKLHLWVGVAVLAVAVVLAVPVIASLVSDGPADAAAFFAVLALGALAVGGMLAWMGRPGGITRFRVDGVRGSVEGVLAGRAARREQLLAEIEERIRTRQARTV